MKASRTLVLLASGIVFLLSVPNAAGQGCVGVMTPSYSTYTTISVDQNNNLYSTVVVEGSAIIHPSPYCNISGTTHRGQVYNQLGSTGGTVFGPFVSPSGYISVSNPQVIVGVPGVVYTNTTEADILCSGVGTIFNGGGRIFHRYGIQLSAYIFNGLSTGRCTWVPTCAGKCSSPHTTNTFDGVRWTNGPYKQCADLTRDGACWDYRPLCYGKSAPGICTNY
jgi:hypothetical protein